MTKCFNYDLNNNKFINYINMELLISRNMSKMLIQIILFQLLNIQISASIESDSLPFPFELYDTLSQTGK